MVVRIKISIWAHCEVVVVIIVRKNLSDVVLSIGSGTILLTKSKIKGKYVTYQLKTEHSVSPLLRLYKLGQAKVPRW